ncbi:MAG: glycerol-3-phosphate 1-O-acyltransferase PlsY [Verrucomicrobia bacterium]|nr:glycerol-3-phosphate 1-O-acyltransferase PlsY [Verrucomicrobiota bacterium]
MNFFTLILSAYLLGSVPFGLLISSLKGVDLRNAGSGNIGATNVFRVVGKSWGLLCFALDFTKGLLAAALLPALLLSEPIPNAGLIAGAAAIAGHNWPVWLKFKGGKGIATSAGVLTAVAPWALLCGLGVWILTMLLSRMVSLSSILAALAVALGGWIFYPDEPWTLAILTALALIAVWRHRTNIQRILKGEEHRFGK